MLPTGRTHISPRDLAAAVDVSESSLKRWADSGLLRVTRTAGGHRRIPVGEAIRFVRETKLRVLDPSLIGLPNVGPTSPDAEELRASELAEFFTAHRGRDAANAIVRAFLSGARVADLCDGPIREGLQSIGDLYKSHDEGIAIEHGAVDSCIQALNTIRHSLMNSDEDAPVAVGGAAAGDPYILPSLSAAVVLEEAGFRAINAGPHTPLEALLATIRREGARLIWRSYSIDLTPKCLEEEHRLLRELDSQGHCEIVLGGRCAQAASAAESGLHAFSALGELSGFAQGLLSSNRRAASNG